MISIRLTERDEQLFRNYAEMHNMTISDMIRSAVLERIEDEFDLKCYNEAIKEYRSNPISYSHEEVLNMLGDHE